MYFRHLLKKNIHMYLKEKNNFFVWLVGNFGNFYLATPCHFFHIMLRRRLVSCLRVPVLAGSTARILSVEMDGCESVPCVVHHGTHATGRVTVDSSSDTAALACEVAETYNMHLHMLDETNRSGQKSDLFHDIRKGRSRPCKNGRFLPHNRWGKLIIWHRKF